MTWNMEWFQDPQQGPLDDALQFQRAVAVFGRAQHQLIALQEVGSREAFARLDAALPHHVGLLADFPWRQKLGVLYDPDALVLVEHAALDGLDDAGRPPMDLSFETLPDHVPLRVVVVHAKARDDAQSHAIRARFARGLARELANTQDGRALVVLGDFNDKLQGSITKGEASPYRPLLDLGLVALTDPPNPRTRGEDSTWGGTVDHILLSQGLAARVAQGSVNVLQDELLALYPDFTRTVSDHFPVVATLEL